ncbi:MAG: hypothetical protein C0594_15405, partial [Marinilabiliales bacterium]
PLNIQLDYVNKQDYLGYETFKLSNGKNDPSFIREVLSYEIVRKYMDAPLSCYARVTINGSYYGLFSSSEAINGDFAKKYFEAEDKVRIKCNPQNAQAGNGCSLEYLGADSSLYYDLYEIKSDSGWFKLIELADAINNKPDSIEEYLDIDRAIWMLAFNNVTSNLDSYTGPFKQNFYLLEEKHGRINSVIWDLNEGFGGFEMVDMQSGPPSPPSLEDLTNLDLFIREGDDTYPLLNLIYDNPRYRKMYVAHCRTMLDENFVSGWYSTKADSLQDFIADEVQTDPNAFYTYSEFTTNLTTTHTTTGFPPQMTVGVTELMEARINYLNGLTDFQYTQPEISNIEVPDTVHPFDTIAISCSIQNGNYAYIGYRHSKDDWFTKVEMFDDGLHEDGVAGDGIWGASIILDENKTHYYIYSENSEAGIFSPLRAEHEYYSIVAENEAAIDGDLVINEIMASNSSVAMDEAGEFDDWVELYNNSQEEISLLGYYLTDDDNDLTKWAFPDTSIQAESYLIIWTDNDPEQQGLHAGFKLSASGEQLLLVNSSYKMVDTLDYSTQTTNLGYARVPNGTGPFVIQQPTFSSSNDLQAIEEFQATEMLIYPNPANDLVTISTDLSGFKYQLFSITGQCVLEGICDQSKLKINVRELETGLYILRAGDSVNKLMISR